MNKTFLLAVLLCLLILNGCGKKAPGCSDDETKALVIQIAQEELSNGLGKELAGKLSLRVEAIRTKEVNEKTGTCYCAADLVLTGPNGSSKLPIEYTSELTDKGDEFYVTVDGL